MKRKKNTIFATKNNSCGSMLVELLLSIALAAVMIPFIFQYHQKNIVRAENIAITNQMKLIQDALERHIIDNREDLLKTVGRNITRVDIKELTPYGLPDSILEQGTDKYQIRILKTSDSVNGASLQGVIVRVSDDISPMRTREIVNMSGGSMGFIDDTHIYGSFGTWHADAMDIGTNIKNGIIETTDVKNNSASYLWRLPSDNPDDAKMMSALNLAAHDILNTKFIDANNTDFTEDISAGEIAVRDLIFQNRTNIDKTYNSKYAVVSGMMSSDSKTIEVSGTFSLADTAKFSSLTAENLWVSNLTLAGLSVDSQDSISTLKINQSLDMTAGRIEALFVTVGFAGSITPRLNVYDMVADSNNSDYFWNAQSGIANFADASFVELNRMATLVNIAEGDAATYSGQIFGTVATNKNATVADFMNAITEIQTRVRAKYQNLQLQ